MHWHHTWSWGLQQSLEHIYAGSQRAVSIYINSDGVGRHNSTALYWFCLICMMWNSIVVKETFHKTLVLTYIEPIWLYTYLLGLPIHGTWLLYWSNTSTYRNIASIILQWLGSICAFCIRTVITRSNEDLTIVLACYEQRELLWLLKSATFIVWCKLDTFNQCSILMNIYKFVSNNV